MSRHVRVAAAVLGGGLIAFAAQSAAQGTLRIAMTAADIPIPNGQTDQGAEGMRFIGYTVFDALIHNVGDLSQAAAVTMRRAVVGFTIYKATDQLTTETTISPKPETVTAAAGG